MGYSATIGREAGSGVWTVLLNVSLTRAEASNLFLSGDSMVSWPVEGLEMTAGKDPRFERSGMFVSEVAARSAGLALRYREEAQAVRAVSLLRQQFAQIGIAEET